MTDVPRHEGARSDSPGGRMSDDGGDPAPSGDEPATDGSDDRPVIDLGGDDTDGSATDDESDRAHSNEATDATPASDDAIRERLDGDAGLAPEDGDADDPVSGTDSDDQAAGADPDDGPSNAVTDADEGADGAQEPDDALAPAGDTDDGADGDGEASGNGTAESADGGAAPADAGADADDGPDGERERDEATADAGVADDPGREAVTLHVRSNLLDTWRRQAEMAKLDLDSFVERMVEAGRMSVNVQPPDDTGAPAMTKDDVADEIRNQLRLEDHLSWADLVDAITRDLEEHVEEALAEMQDDNEVRYSGLHGGYELVEEDE